MENNNNDIRDEILEFPSNYEEIVNQELINLEKSNKIDLDKLIKQSLKNDKNNINEDNKNKENEWEDIESDGDEYINNNNYQKFEDDDYLEDKNEEENKIFESNEDDNKETEIKNKNNHDIPFSNIKIINNKEKISEIKYKENVINNNKDICSKEKNDLKKKKLSNEEMKKMILKIDYTPPNWARNLSDQEFINKIKTNIK